MKQSKQKIIHLTKRDIGLILGICTLAAILNVYPYPFVAAGAVVIGILLLRLTENHHESTEPGFMQKSQAEQTVEKRSAQEIITDKLNDGVIEKSIEERFEKMVTKIMDDLFGSHGDITRQIQKRLRETMSPYIEQVDFDKIKLEPLPNELVVNGSDDKDGIGMLAPKKEQETNHCHKCDGTGITKPVGGYNVFCEYCDGTGKISK